MPYDKMRMKCVSDQAIFYKEMMRTMLGFYKVNKLFQIDLDNLSWKCCDSGKAWDPITYFTYFQDADGNVRRVKYTAKEHYGI